MVARRSSGQSSAIRARAISPSIAMITTAHAGAEPIGEQADMQHADRAGADADRQHAHDPRARLRRRREKGHRALHHREAGDADAGQQHQRRRTETGEVERPIPISTRRKTAEE